MRSGDVRSAIFLAFLSVIVIGRAYAEVNVCEILARNLQPDTIVQGSKHERFSQIQQLISDKEYEEFKNATTSSLDGTLLSDYVDIFLKTNSTADNWHQNRKEFLSMNSQTAYASDQGELQVSRFNTGALQQITECQKVYANAKGFSAVLTNVSINRDSFTVLITNSTDGVPGWKLTEFAPQPRDPQFHCSNGYDSASLKTPQSLITNSVLITCSKSPEAHFLLGVQTSAGPAKQSFTLESVHEEIREIREETEASIQTLKSRLDKHGEVAAFAASVCPAPWSLYEPAVGRFVRGLDPKGENDPEGTNRQPGSIQLDAVGPHVHSMGVNGADSYQMVSGGASQRLAHFSGDVYGAGPKKQTDTNVGSETRPKNVALIYCILN